MSSTLIAVGGQAASRERRKAVSAGKSGMAPPAERTRNGNGPVVHGVVLAHDEPNGATRNVTPHDSPSVPSPASAPAAAPARAVASSPYANMMGSTREIARMRRAAQCRVGRGTAAPAGPTRPPRPTSTGATVYGGSPQFAGQSDGTVLAPAPRITQSQTPVARVTGVAEQGGLAVTGAARGAYAAVSGTPGIGQRAGSFASAKVRLSQTAGGALVSGTLVRSNVPITGDEAGNHLAITGEVDALSGADITPQREGAVTLGGARGFGARHNPIGALAGSRERARRAAVEVTERGMPVTGNPVGRSLRVTGDEAGACLNVTGDQYLAPARRQAECGGVGGGTARQAYPGARRPDPAAGSAVVESRTWGNRRVTGIDVDVNVLVTGGRAGVCAPVTGTPYVGAAALVTECDPVDAVANVARNAPRPSNVIVTGDAPLDSRHVTGAATSVRAVTGTPYVQTRSGAHAPPIEPPFSVRPSLTALGRSANAASQITGSFALAHGKVTGNAEFAFRPRTAANGDERAARQRLTGEGRVDGHAITGAAWGEHGRVTGTDGAFAAGRNPSMRNGGAGKPFAGTRRFAEFASSEDPKHLVTGTFGYASDNAAKVTLSGGAQG